MGNSQASSAQQQQQQQQQPPPPPPPPAYPTEGLEPLMAESPDAEAIGNAGWTILHTTAAAYPTHPTAKQQRRMWDFINAWSHIYPCGHCAAHMRIHLRKEPPAVASKEDLSLWTCRLHNEVNERLGKDPFECEINRLLARWHPTYPEVDGTDQKGGMQDLPPYNSEAAKAQQQHQQQPAGGSSDPDLQALADMQCSAFCPKEAKKAE